VRWAGYDAGRAKIILAAVGAYQLIEMLAASRRLAERKIAHHVVYLLEPGRFRQARTDGEQGHQATAVIREELFPPEVPARLCVTHTRPEVIQGLLGPLWSGKQSRVLGYIAQGGTLNTSGLMFINRCTWAHCLEEAAKLLGISRDRFLTAVECDALDGRMSPQNLIIPDVCG